MLTALHIERFRGFESLELPNLARVNLIAGENNTGKTALLEAIALSLAEQDQVASRLATWFRQAGGHPSEETYWRWLIHRPARGRTAVIEARLPGVDRSFRLELGRRGELKSTGAVGDLAARRTASKEDRGQLPVAAFSTTARDPASEAVLYAQVARTAGGEERIEALLRSIEPRLRKIRALPVEGRNEWMTYADIGLDELVPITQLGQGFSRILNLYAALVRADGKVCLLDEIENGLHYSILPDVWKALAAASERDRIQIFATTHSRECIMAAREAFVSSEPNAFALHRLERVGGEVAVHTYDAEALDAADAGFLEVR